MDYEPTHPRVSVHPRRGAAAWLQAVGGRSARFVESALGAFAGHVVWDTTRHPASSRVSTHRLRA